MHYLIFVVALVGLLLSARLFTKAAETIGTYFALPSFVIGVFIVGMGTSLPELISGIISVSKQSSEIVAGNIIGANISNILLITGLVVVINKKNITIKSEYLFIDLHFLLGSFGFLYIISYDGEIELLESLFGLVMMVIFSIYLVKGQPKPVEISHAKKTDFPVVSLVTLIGCAAGIYFGANYTIIALEQIAVDLAIPSSIVALTLLSLGTTLPELAVNITAIKQGKTEMAIGNVLGSCIFNSLVIPPVATFFGNITVSQNLLTFSLPLMAACGLFFYLLVQDKKVSVWEGWLFICLYGLFLVKIITG